MSKSDNERASRIRRAIREHRAGRGKAPSDRDSKWLALRDAERPPRAAREREPELEPREPELPPAPPDDLVELGPAPAPATPATPSSATPATPGASPAAMSLTPPGAHVPGLCPVGPDCPGCSGRLDTEAKVCVKTGRPVFPEIAPHAARGFAKIAIGLIAWGVRLYAKWMHGRELPAVAPTDLEVEELADAFRSIFRTRASVGWIGNAFGDLAAVGNALHAVGSRQMRAAPATGDATSATPVPA